MEHIIPTTITVELPLAIKLSLKEYLIKHHGFSSGLWKRVKHSGTLMINSAAILNPTKTVVSRGDIISYRLSSKKASLIPEDIPLDIIYEDEDLLVINKAPDMLVHPTSFEHSGTLANAVLHHYARQGLSLDFHPVHRLDRRTSGLILIAKRPEVHYRLTKANKRPIRHYLALVEGALPQVKGEIDAPIARALPSIILRKVDSGGKRAITHYEVLGIAHSQNLSPSYEHTYSLVRLILATGRTHQIRVHLSYIGHPLLGDDLYGGAKNLIARHALHSSYLELAHPQKKELTLKLSAPLPSDMASLNQFIQTL